MTSLYLGTPTLTLKWSNPDHDHRIMTEKIKNEIEIEGYSQLVTGYTRTWPGQVSSLLDQCWTNCSNRIVSCRNIVRATSDHNLIEVVIRVKGVNSAPREAIRRQRSNFNIEEYRRRITEIDWTDLYETDDIDIGYDLFENNIKSILDDMAPLRKIQLKTKNKCWLSSETKDTIKTRDNIRTEAVEKDDPDLWRQYKILRNKCTSMVRRDKNENFTNLYKI